MFRRGDKKRGTYNINTLIICGLVLVGTKYLDTGETFNPIPPSELLVFVRIHCSNPYYAL